MNHNTSCKKHISMAKLHKFLKWIKILSANKWEILSRKCILKSEKYLVYNNKNNVTLHMHQSHSLIPFTPLVIYPITTHTT